MMDGFNDHVVTITVARTREPLARRAQVARSILQRVIGLLGRRGLSDDEALILPACRSIHMCGMRFPIDAIFVDRAWRVVALRENLKPWRIALPRWGAWGVIEVAQGTLKRVKLEVGDQLLLTASKNE